MHPLNHFVFRELAFDELQTRLYSSFFALFLLIIYYLPINFRFKNSWLIAIAFSSICINTAHIVLKSDFHPFFLTGFLLAVVCGFFCFFNYRILLITNTVSFFAFLIDFKVLHQLNHNSNFVIGFHLNAYLILTIFTFMKIRSNKIDFNLRKEIALKKTELSIASKFESMGKLAGGICHEIQNPLAISLGFLNILSKKNKNTELLEDISKIEKNLLRISQTVACLNVITSKGGVTEISNVNIHDLLEEVKKLCAPLLTAHNINFHIHQQDKNVFVKGAQETLSQVLINLMNNSIDALEGFKNKNIRIEVQSDSLSVKINVIDNGSGISEEIQDKIMDPFFSTKEFGKGTGLGLSMCRGIIENHGGEIDFSSKDRETIFSVFLPLV